MPHVNRVFVRAVRYEIYILPITLPLGLRLLKWSMFSSMFLHQSVLSQLILSARCLHLQCGIISFFGNYHICRAMYIQMANVLPNVTQIFNVPRIPTVSRVAVSVMWLDKITSF